MSGLEGRSVPAPRPMRPIAANTNNANAYDRLPEARSETRIVPAMAVPREEPRLETLRDKPEISPCCASGKADCTTLTDGVSIVPVPRPINRSPGGKTTRILSET